MGKCSLMYGFEFEMGFEDRKKMPRILPETWKTARRARAGEASSNAAVCHRMDHRKRVLTTTERRIREILGNHR